MRKKMKTKIEWKYNKTRANMIKPQKLDSNHLRNQEKYRWIWELSKPNVTPLLLHKVASVAAMVEAETHVNLVLVLPH